MTEPRMEMGAGSLLKMCRRTVRPPVGTVHVVLSSQSVSVMGDLDLASLRHGPS